MLQMMAASKSTRLKALGRACLPPAIVNINEPVVFGAIAWNPVLMVPMWLQGLIPPILVWLLTKTIRFAPIPMNQFELWYTPYPLATWITTRSLSAIVLMLLVFAVSAVIWYPFFKVYEHQSLLKEARDSAGSEAGRTGGPDGRSEARVAGRTGQQEADRRRRPSAEHRRGRSRREPLRWRRRRGRREPLGRRSRRGRARRLPGEERRRAPRHQETRRDLRRTRITGIGRTRHERHPRRGLDADPHPLR